jgi:hypothetical protein
MLMILWYPDQQQVAPLGFYIIGIDHPWKDPKGPVRMVCQSTCVCICYMWSVMVAPLGFYILGNLLIPGNIPKVR